MKFNLFIKTSSFLIVLKFRKTYLQILTLFENKEICKKIEMRMLCQQYAQSDEIIEGSPADKTWLMFNFEIIPPAFKIPWSIEKTIFQRAVRQSFCHLDTFKVPSHPEQLQYSYGTILQVNKTA